jgi:DNA topoisomerase VI subunit B
LYHPLFQVNNLTIQQLLEQTGQKSLLKFLTSDLSGISPSVGKTLIERLGSTYSEDMSPSELNDKQITRLVQLLRSAGNLFKSPDGACLSPLGEYNLNLGIKKVVEPDVIATARDKPGAYDGHPFIVEAAVSLGGKDAKEGITVVRFANRIPLLFEGGADVATRVANGKIKWATYKIDHKKDRIGVFVSIVSTKVPFKGTGKEYIGDDITEIQHSVKRAIQSCCQQLRAHLAKRNALRDVKERKSRLLKYIPDVSRSVFGLLDGMRKRRLEKGEGMTRIASPRKRVSGISPVMRSKTSEVEIASMINDLSEGILTEDTIKQRLVEAVEANASAGIGDDEDELGGKTKPEKDECDRQPLYLVPLYEDLKDMQLVIRHSLFDFFPMHIVT